MDFTGQLFEHARLAYGVEAEHPWNDEKAILRHPCGKWFAGFFYVRPRSLEIITNSTQPLPIMNVKTGPLLGASYRGIEGVRPAWHMNKNHWISVLLDGTVGMPFLQELLEVSWRKVEGRRKGLRARCGLE